MKGRVKVGVIASAHGVKGQVKLRFFTETPEEFLAIGSLTDAHGKPYRVKKRGVKEKLLIVSIDGITDRNQSELLKGTELFAPADELVETDENQWTYAELTGLEARLASGTPYGKVIGVYNFGAGDLIELQLADGKTEMLPFTEPFTLEVHAEEGYLIVSPPDYLEVQPGEDNG